MLHVDQLLCLVSGQSPASAVLRQAVHFVHSLGATLHVMPIDGDVTPDDFRQSWGEYASPSETVEMNVVPSLGKRGRSVGAVRRFVEETGIDLILVDTPGDSGPVPPLADSFVGALMKELDRPIYVVNHVADPKAIRRILVPTDLSDPSLQALKHAIGLTSVYEASIVLLHVIETSPYVALTTMDRLSLRGTTLPEHRARRRLQNFVDATRGADVPVHSHLSFGEPVNQISHFVDREEFDLVVLSSHGTTPSTQPFGSVAGRVLGRVNVPVFLVKAFGSSLLTGKSGLNALSEVEMDE